MSVRENKYIRGLGREKRGKERNDLEVIGIDGRVIRIRTDLKNRTEGHGLDSSGSG
jgi:hypothetical protein